MRPKLKFLLAAAALTFVTAQAEASTISISLLDTFDPEDVFITNQTGSVNGGAICTGINDSDDLLDAVTIPAGPLDTCGSLSWTHSLFPPPNNYNLGTDTLTSGSIVLTFYDDEDSPEETFDLWLDLLPILNNTVTSGSTSALPYELTWDVSSDILDGLLDAYFTNDGEGNHDFYFAKSVLTAKGTRFVDDGEIDDQALTETPEPTSMVLLGTG